MNSDKGFIYGQPRPIVNSLYNCASADHNSINQGNVIHSVGHNPHIGDTSSDIDPKSSSFAGRLCINSIARADQKTINSLAHSTTHQQETKLKTKINREREEASDLCSRPETKAFCQQKLYTSKLRSLHERKRPDSSFCDGNSRVNQEHSDIHASNSTSFYDEFTASEVQLSNRMQRAAAPAFPDMTTTRENRTTSEEMPAVNRCEQAKSTSLLNSKHNNNTSGNGVSMFNNYCEYCDCMSPDYLNRTERLAKQPYEYRSFKKEQFPGIDPENLVASIACFEKIINIMRVVNDSHKMQAALVAFPPSIVSSFLEFGHSTSYLDFKKYILDMAIPKYACHNNSKFKSGVEAFHDFYLYCRKASECPRTEILKAEIIRRAPVGIKNKLIAHLYLPIHQFRYLACAEYEANKRVLLSKNTVMTNANLSDRAFTDTSTRSDGVTASKPYTCFYHFRFGNKARKCEGRRCNHYQGRSHTPSKFISVGQSNDYNKSVVGTRHTRRSQKFGRDPKTFNTSAKFKPTPKEQPKLNTIIINRQSHSHSKPSRRNQERNLHERTSGSHRRKAPNQRVEATYPILRHIRYPKDTLIRLNQSKSATVHAETSQKNVSTIRKNYTLPQFTTLRRKTIEGRESFITRTPKVATSPPPPPLRRNSHSRPQLSFIHSFLLLVLMVIFTSNCRACSPDNASKIARSSANLVLTPSLPKASWKAKIFHNKHGSPSVFSTHLCSDKGIEHPLKCDAGATGTSQTKVSLFCKRGGHKKYPYHTTNKRTAKPT